MPRTPALAVLGLILSLAATACAGSDPVETPAAATRPPPTEAATATATATAPSTPQAEATQPPATDTPTPRATPTQPPATATPTEEPDGEGDISSQIVTLLPPDAIPAIDNPSFVSAEEADEQLRPVDLVIGISIDGEHRAYGAAFLSGHEIVNDMLGGRAIAVTW